MSDNNIIRFPTTPKERTRFLAKSENPIHRNLTRLRHLTGWALVFSCVVFLATNFTMLSPSSISQTLSYIQITQAEPDSTLLNSISYPTGAVNSAAPFGGGLALVDSDTLYVAQTGGLVQQSTQLSYTDPVIRSNGRQGHQPVHRDLHACQADPGKHHSGRFSRPEQRLRRCHRRNRLSRGRFGLYR